MLHTFFTLIYKKAEVAEIVKAGAYKLPRLLSYSLLFENTSNIPTLGTMILTPFLRALAFP